MKFGGTSVANAQRIAKVVDIVAEAIERDRTIMVVSAISGCTDTLIETGHRAALKDKSYQSLLDELQEQHHRIILDLLPLETHEPSLETCDETFEQLRSIAQGVYLLGELSPVSLDAIQGCGELLSTKIIATKLASVGLSTKWVDSRDIIRTVVSDGHSVVDTEKTNALIRGMVDDNPITQVFVVPGFIASDTQGRMTTLGRGGSDYSASLYAVGSNARLLEIWTDVPGMMTCNPKAVPSSRTIGNISYRAALELSHFGAKVIYPPTIQPVVAQGIPIYVKNTFDPSAHGTLIEKNPPRSRSKIIGISNSDNIALLSLEGSGMVGIPGFSSRLFDTLSRSGINIILITQASSVHTMCIAVSEQDAERAKEAADTTFAYEISLGKLNPLKVEKGFSIVCLVGDDILNQSGATGQMMAALGRRGIGIRATAQGSSERNISVIVPSERVDEALQCIHNEFFDKSSEKIINLFIACFGGVGRSLVELIRCNGEKIAARTGKRIRVIGLSNSRRYVMEAGGIDLARADELLAAGKSAADGAYFEALAGLSMENSVFVDCTGSADIAYKYLNLFKRGYSVVASNKITFSSPYSQYELLRKSAVAAGVSLKYETTVGAALPILETIARCVNSGDAIHKIEAALSGTLGYIFSSYKGGSFAAVVREAQKAGYTEPDPRLDLSGRDVLRKLLILSREAGVPLEESDVEMDPILAPEYFKGGVDKFYERLEANDAVFEKEFGHGTKRYVATLERQEDGSYKASIGLRALPSEHPLARLRGTDNCAVITTDFYPSPLLVQGAGAGAVQTASGVLNDILL